MANQFIGNDDYRGYLNYLGSQGNSQAKALLGYVGNDAQFGSSLAPLVAQGSSGDAIHSLGANNQQFYQQYQQLHPTGTSPATNIGSIYGGGTAPVYAPKLDLAAINSQARSAAENAVNPYYTKQLNEFLTQQGVQKQQHQQQAATDVQNLQDQLANTLQGNEVSRGRAVTDEATQQANINTQNDRNQVDTGTQFEDQRLAAARGQATAGTLGTNAGNRATTLATDARNLTEGRQNQDFQAQRDQQALLKGRSLEDLLRSDTLSTQSEAKGEAQSKFDLDNYIQSLGYQEQQTRNSLEQERLQRVGQETQNQAKLGFNNYLSTIKNPAQYAAAVSTYGGSF